MTKMFAIDFCPICGGGLLGIRLCQGRAKNSDSGQEEDSPEGAEDVHGLVVCDECEAIWLEPDSSKMHLYPDAENACCPVCQADLWSDSHWASRDEISQLGWSRAIREELVVPSDVTIGEEPDSDKRST